LHARFHLEGLTHAFKFLSSDAKCNAVTANSRRKSVRKGALLEYYDQFAYLPLGRESGFADIKTKRRWDKQVQRTVMHEIGDEPHKVASAFGGCAIYKVKALMNPKIRYSAAPAGRLGCEHVYFHENLSGIYFDPSMLIEILHNPG